MTTSIQFQCLWTLFMLINSMRLFSTNHTPSYFHDHQSEWHISTSNRNAVICTRHLPTCITCSWVLGRTQQFTLPLRMVLYQKMWPDWISFPLKAKQNCFHCGFQEATRYCFYVLYACVFITLMCLDMERPNSIHPVDLNRLCFGRCWVWICWIFTCIIYHFKD